MYLNRRNFIKLNFFSLFLSVVQSQSIINLLHAKGDTNKSDFFLIIDIGKTYINELKKKNENILDQLSSELGYKNLNYSDIFEFFINNIEIFKKRIKNDIKNNQICIYNGYELAETECKICAVASIEYSNYIIKKSEIEYKLDDFTEVLKWGPKSGSKNSGFNIQKNRSSSIWIKTKGSSLNNSYYIIKFGDLLLKTTSGSSGLITGDLDQEDLKNLPVNQNVFEVYLLDTQNKKKQFISNFYFKEKIINNKNINLSNYKIIDWGPKKISRDKQFNLQKNNK